MLDNSDKLGFWDKLRRLHILRKEGHITLSQAFWMYWE